MPTAEEEPPTKEEEEGVAGAATDDDSAAPVPAPAPVAAETAPAVEIPSGEEEPSVVAETASRSLEPTSEAAVAVDDVTVAAGDVTVATDDVTVVADGDGDVEVVGAEEAEAGGEDEAAVAAVAGRCPSTMCLSSCRLIVMCFHVVWPAFRERH